MSRKPSFANLRTPATPAPQAAIKVEVEERTGSISSRPVSRTGRKQIAGFFTLDMSFAMHTLARRQGKSLQMLMAEAFDDVLRKYGESPIGE